MCWCILRLCIVYLPKTHVRMMYDMYVFTLNVRVCVCVFMIIFTCFQDNDALTTLSFPMLSTIGGFLDIEVSLVLCVVGDKKGVCESGKRGWEGRRGEGGNTYVWTVDVCACSCVWDIGLLMCMCLLNFVFVCAAGRVMGVR